MFRGTSDEPVLCDLGVSRMMASAGRMSGYAGHGGTVLYLAPELLANEAACATGASDM